MITCSHCGQTKSDYNFFRFLNKFDKTFFVAGIPSNSDVCFDCGGPYRCLCCGEVKTANHFRVMGRICDACKGGNPTFDFTSKVGLNAIAASGDTYEAENSVNNAVSADEIARDRHQWRQE